jgi:hypothetical protein
VQGVTERVAGTLVDGHAGFRSLYVGMTRGIEQNVAYVVCEEGESAREVLDRALRRDRADLGALRQARALEAIARKLEVSAPAPAIPQPHERKAPARDVPELGLEIKR